MMIGVLDCVEYKTAWMGSKQGLLAGCWDAECGFVDSEFVLLLMIPLLFFSCSVESRNGRS